MTMMKRILLALTLLLSIIGVGYVPTLTTPAAAGTVQAINIANAITDFHRTTSSGTSPMGFSITFGPNVYAGYVLHLEDYSSNSFLPAYLVQNVHYRLTNDDLQSGADLSAHLAAAGWVAPGSTDSVRASVYTTSPNAVGALYIYPTGLSPTDPAGHRYWKLTFQTGPNVLRSMEMATTIGGADAAGGRTYSTVPTSAGTAVSGPCTNFKLLCYFDANTGTIGALDTNTSGYPAAIIIDFSSNIDLHQLRLVSGSQSFGGPAAFTFAYSDDNITYTTVVTASGLTWNAVSDETKTWSW